MRRNIQQDVYKRQRLDKLILAIVVLFLGAFIGNYVQRNKEEVKTKLKKFIDKMQMERVVMNRTAIREQAFKDVYKRQLYDSRRSIKVWINRWNYGQKKIKINKNSIIL